MVAVLPVIDDFPPHPQVRTASFGLRSQHRVEERLEVLAHCRTSQELDVAKVDSRESIPRCVDEIRRKHRLEHLVELSGESRSSERMTNLRIHHDRPRQAVDVCALLDHGVGYPHRRQCDGRGESHRATTSDQYVHG